MTDRHHEDRELSRLYREGAWPEPRRQLDEAILEASRRAARARRSASFVWRWGPRFALAATVVLTSSLLLRMSQEMPGEKIAPSLSPAVRRAQHAAPPVRPADEQKPLAETRPGQASQSAPVQEYAPTPAPATPLATTPAPAASALALKKEAPAAARADQIQRQPDFQQRFRAATQPRDQIQTEAVRAPALTPAAPAPGTSAASSGSASNQLMGTRGSAALVERSPETWLDDVRKLKAQGRTEDAERELAEFRKRYPDFRLPDDLR